MGGVIKGAYMNLAYILILVIALALLRDYFEIKKLKKDVKKLLDDKKED